MAGIGAAGERGSRAPGHDKCGLPHPEAGQEDHEEAGHLGEEEEGEEAADHGGHRHWKRTRWLWRSDRIRYGNLSAPDRCAGGWLLILTGPRRVQWFNPSLLRERSQHANDLDFKFREPR